MQKIKQKPSLRTIKNELKHVKEYDVIIFGSYASKYFTPRSDIDVAVITRESNPKKNIDIWKALLGKTTQRYHLNIFELLPLHVKIEIMDDAIVIFGDKLEISEYFYHFRKLWKDVKPRYEANQFNTFKEKVKC